MSTGIFARLGMCRWPFLLIVGSAMLVGQSAFAYQHTPSVGVDPRSGIQVEMGLPFRQQPMSGFIPLHVRISNRTRQAHTWEVSSVTGGSGWGMVTFRSRAQMTVGAGQVRDFDLLIPRAGMVARDQSYQYVRATFSGYGIDSGNFSLPSNHSSGMTSSFVAISKELADPVWSMLEADLKKSPPVSVSDRNLAARRFSGVSSRSDRALSGSAVDLRELPPDPRTFAGIAALWLTLAEWEGWSAMHRTAVRQWILGGGHLFIAYPGERPATLTNLDLPPAEVTSHAVGFGAVHLERLEKGELPVAATTNSIRALDKHPIPAWKEDFDRDWKLPAAVGWPRLNVSLIIGFVCAFGLLIGPVNLHWFAPAERRYRLFLTVPLFSIGASVALLAVIFLSDGVGGVGARNGILLLLAGENRSALVQEQVVRSKLLFGRSFLLPEEASISVVPQNEGREERRAMERTGGSLTGDWFRSRAVQAHLLRTTRPSRAEVVLQSTAAGGAPTLLSTVPSILRNVHYVDADGQYWHAAELMTGRPVTLTPSNATAYERWIQEVSAVMSPNLLEILSQTRGRPGYFYGSADPMPEGFLETLPSIQWQRQMLVCLGPCGKAGTR